MKHLLSRIVLVKHGITCQFVSAITIAVVGIEGAMLVVYSRSQLTRFAPPMVANVTSAGYIYVLQPSGSIPLVERCRIIFHIVDTAHLVINNLIISATITVPIIP